MKIYSKTSYCHFFRMMRNILAKKIVYTKNKSISISYIDRFLAKVQVQIPTHTNKFIFN